MKRWPDLGYWRITKGVRRKRYCIDPNPGFCLQLRTWHDTKYNLEESEKKIGKLLSAKPLIHHWKDTEKINVNY